jgi:hypothetical protein
MRNAAVGDESRKRTATTGRPRMTAQLVAARRVLEHRAPQAAGGLSDAALDATSGWRVHAGSPDGALQAQRQLRSHNLRQCP